MDDKRFTELTLSDLKEIFHQSLDPVFDKNEVDRFFYLSLDHILGKSRLNFTIDPMFVVSEKAAQIFKTIVSRLQSHEPIQYVIGETEFFGLKFGLNHQVLIPRPETEELVDHILRSDLVKRNEKYLNILDIGTGSGCIAVTLAKNLSDAKLFAIDVSESALEIAQKNAILNEVDIAFGLHDILSGDSLFFEIKKGKPVKYDVIVSNPPYVRESEKIEMKPNVLDFEPDLALFVPNDDPLVFYSAIADFAVNNLKDSGWLFFEINQYLGEELMKMLKSKGFNNLSLVKDMNGNDRIVKCSRQ
jgi:release factor glutamine methyltransferase